MITLKLIFSDTKFLKKITSALFALFFLTACKTEWSYEKKGAPQFWGDLSEKNKFCKIGYNQSPIDITQNFEPHDLKTSYHLSEIEKERKNFVMNINFFGENFLWRGKKKYLLRSLAFHHPSEHLVGGEPYSLEMQISHKSEDEQWLNLAFFLEVGKENSQMQKLISLLHSRQETESQNQKINLAEIVNLESDAFFYEGSFTTPPCKEGVKWYVIKKPITISKEQMSAIIKSSIFVPTNARPIQEFHPEKY